MTHDDARKLAEEVASDPSQVSGSIYPPVAVNLARALLSVIAENEKMATALRELLDRYEYQMHRDYDETTRVWDSDQWSRAARALLDRQKEETKDG